MEEIPRRKAYTQSTVHSKSAMAIRASAIKLQACDSVEIVIVPEIYYWLKWMPWRRKRENRYTGTSKPVRRHPSKSAVLTCAAGQWCRCFIRLLATWALVNSKKSASFRMTHTSTYSLWLYWLCCDWWLVLICCERKILLASWWLVADIGVREKYRWLDAANGVSVLNY